jgi:cytochrome P450
MASIPPKAPTAPGRLPLLGHTIPFLRAPVATLQSLRGHGDVVLVHLGRRPVYVVNSPELLHRILVTEADMYAKGRVFDKARPFLGNGLATSDGAFHLRQRRLMLPAFHREHLRRHTEVMHTQAAAICAPWKAGRQIAVDQSMYELACSVTTRALFDCAPHGAVMSAIQQWLPVFLKGAMRRAISPIDLWEKLPTPGNRRFQQASTGLKMIIDDVIAAYRTDPAGRTGLLPMLADARDEDTGEVMSHSQLRDELMTILIGGTETVGTTLSWLFYEIALHPGIEARLHHEIDTALGDRPIAFDDVPSLTYTRRLLQETLRLHSPVWLTMRRATVPVELAGMRLPAGSELLFSPATLHRDPMLYRDPHRFDPDRWQSAPVRDTYLPFGAGRHKCIGDYFGLTEMVVSVATIGAAWRLRTAPGYTVRELALSTLRPHRLPMVLEARHK